MSNKARKVSGATAGNLPEFDSSGDLVDSGYSPKKKKSVTYSGSRVNLTTSDLGKMIKLTSDDVIAYLPSVGSGQVDSWIMIVRLGDAKCEIRAADSDTIEKSSPGGAAICDEPGRVAANLTLVLVTETQWAIESGTGIWAIF